MKEYNPKLKNWLANTPNKEAGINNIQKTQDVELIVWQTRPNVPSEYELSLAEHLINSFDEGVTDIKQLVAKLNESGLRHKGGQPFTVESFSAEMSKLGY